MPETFFDLIEHWELAKEVANSKKSSVDEVLYPILEIFGHTKVGIENIDISRDFVSVEVDWSRRGLCSNMTVYIPRYIMESENPLESAKKHIERINAEKQLQIRKNKIEELERLQKELYDK